LGTSPFQALYGHPPRHFGLVPDDACVGADLKQWLAERSLMTKIIQDHLHRAQQRMKQQADKHRQEREFQVGDWVYVKLQPYIQMSVATRSNKKLSYKYFDPTWCYRRLDQWLISCSFLPKAKYTMSFMSHN
jgi:hypothetical protein